MILLIFKHGSNEKNFNNFGPVWVNLLSIIFVELVSKTR
jgi:hypothetical protein